MPGLIDAHVHVLLTTFDAHEAHNWTAGYATVRALAEAERMLRRGFTTVRDLACGDPDYPTIRGSILAARRCLRLGATETCAPSPMTANPDARCDRISRVSPTEWMRYVRPLVTSFARAQHI